MRVMVTPSPLAYISLAATALTVSLPFLVPLHTAPIPSFYAEWIAAITGLIAVLVLTSARRLPLPGATLLAVALAAVAEVQVISGRAPLPRLAELFALYLVWAGLLACAVAALAEALGRARLASVLASAMLAGSLLAAVLGMLHPLLVAVGWPGFPIRSGGPLGQLNHLTVYLWLGLASALFLRITGKLSPSGFWLAACALTLVAVLAGQRSSFLYAAALVAIARWAGAPAESSNSPSSLRLASGIGLLFLALQVLMVMLPTRSETRIAPPPAMRAVQQFEGPSIRLQFLVTGIAGIAAEPLFGNGVGGFPRLAISLADSLPTQHNPGPAEHAHNLLADLGAELGLPAMMTVVVATIVWFRRLRHRVKPVEAFWAAAVVGFLGLHSMVEYPLWHAYFMGLVAVVAGGFGSRRAIEGRLAPTALALGALALGSLTLVELRRDYAQIEFAIAAGNAREAPALLPLAKAALLKISPDSLLAPWVQTVACQSLDPLTVNVPDGIAVCKAATAIEPSAIGHVHLAVLLWRMGETAQAERLVRRLRRASQSSKVDALLAPLRVREPRLRTFGDVAP